MKKIIVILSLLYTSCLIAQSVKLGVVEIDKFVGRDAGFVGKINGNYLFTTANPVNHSEYFYFNKNAPEFYLLNNELKEIGYTNIENQFKELELYNSKYQDIVIFSNNIFIVVLEKTRGENVSKYYLYKLDSKTLQINLKEKIHLFDIELWTEKATQVVGSSFQYSISEDRSKLSFTVSRYMTPGFKAKGLKGLIAKTIVFDTALNKMYNNTLQIDPINDTEEISGYNPYVLNDGCFYLLLKYVVKKIDKNFMLQTIRDYPVYNIRTYFIDKNGNGKQIEIGLPNDVYVTPGVQISANNNSIIIAGFPSLNEFDKYYSSFGLKVFGYFNKVIDKEEKTLGLNVFPFDKYFVDDLKRGNGLLKNHPEIQYDGTFLLEDGTFFMISQLSGKDIIISYMSKSGKTIWLKSIERAHAGPERIRYIYKKETKDLCLVYEDNIEGTGMYYSKVNIDSTISASIPIIPKLRLFGNNRFAAENEIIVSDVSKGKITFAVITF